MNIIYIYIYIKLWSHIFINLQPTWIKGTFFTGIPILPNLNHVSSRGRFAFYLPESKTFLPKREVTACIMISVSSKSDLPASLSQYISKQNTCSLNIHHFPFAIQGQFVHPLKKRCSKLPTRNNAESRLDSWVFNLRPAGSQWSFWFWGPVLNTESCNILLVGGWTNPSRKNITVVNMGFILPKFGMNINKNWNHHLDYLLIVGKGFKTPESYSK